MRFRDLGPLTIEVLGRDRPVGGRRLESVLSALLVSAGAPVTVDSLVESVWGSAPPPQVSGSLDTLIWRLRRILEPERPARAPSTVLLTADLGYLLRIPADAVDSTRFVAAAETSAVQQDSGDLDSVLKVTADALLLWRGDPYQGVLDGGWLEPIRARLSEIRVGLHHRRIEALLGTGQPERAVTELSPLLALFPFHEKLWAQQMVGLYRSGRQSDALDAFRRAQRLLDDELGVKPGPKLRTLERRVLEQDATLHLEGGWAKPPARPVVRLPRRRVRLVGRDAELTTLSDAIVRQQIVMIAGPMGCGKTSLATAVAGQVSAEFSAGVWFVELSEVTDPADIPGQLAGRLGVDIPADVDILAAVTAFTADLNILLVLDNCEQVVTAVADIVEELTADAPALHILLTSREPLGIAAEWEYRLRPLPIPGSASGRDLATNPAVELFVQRIGNLGRVVDLSGPDGPLVASICSATDGLPLSLELAAARVRSLDLHEIAANLARNPGALAGQTGRRTDPKRRITLRDGVEASFKMAPAEEQVVHRRLSVLPAGMTLAAATAVCAHGTIAADQVVDLIGGLVYRSLLEMSPPARTAGPSHYRQLIPIRAHAAETLLDADEAQLTSRARDRWVMEKVAAGRRIGRPGQAAFYDFLDDNYSTITTTLEEGCRKSPVSDDIKLTVARLGQYWSDRERSVDTHRWLPLAARANLGESPSTADNFADAAAAVSYGNALAFDQQMPAAIPWLQSAMPLLTNPPADNLTEAAELLLLAAACVWVGDDWGFARTIALQAQRHGERLQDPQVLLAARSVVAAADIVIGDPASAVAEASRVLAENAVIGNGLAGILGAVTMSIATMASNDAVNGLHWSTETLRAQRKMGIRSLADTFETRGGQYVNAGQNYEAVRCYAAAASHQRRMGRSWPRHPGTAERVEKLQQQLPADEYRRAWASGDRLDLGQLAADWL